MIAVADEQGWSPTATAPPRPTPRLLGPLTTCLLALVVLTPWVPSLALPLGALTAAMWGLLAAETHQVPWSPPVVVAAALPLSQLLSLPWALDVPRSLVLTALAVLGWVAAASMCAIGPRRAWLVLVAGAVNLLAVSLHALAGMGTIASHQGGAIVEGRLQGPFAQPNELGAYVVLLLPVLVTATTRGRAVTPMRLLWMAGLPALAVGALSLSRGSWLGLLVSLSALVLLQPPVRRALLKLGLGALAMLAGLLALDPGGLRSVVLDRLATVGDPGASSEDHRTMIWAFAVRVASERPVTGVGAGGLEAAAASSDSPLAGVPPLHAHDLLLAVLVEGGLVGLAAMLALGLAVVHHTLRCAGDGADRVRLPALAALAGAAAHGLIDVPWRHPGLTVTLWVLVGAVGVVAGTGPPTTAHRPLHAHRSTSLEEEPS